MFNTDLDFMQFRNASYCTIVDRMNNRCIIDKHFHFDAVKYDIILAT